MRICVVGAGWYGCHAAITLQRMGVSVDLVDKEGFFAGASSKNQNRLHLGYHYPRSPDTIAECIAGYTKFIAQYGFCVQPVSRNLYLIHNQSRVSGEEYRRLFPNHEPVSVGTEFRDVDPVAMRVDERFIDNALARSYFEKKLHGAFQRRVGHIDTDRYDYIVNCTNNAWKPVPFEATHECFCSLVYEIKFPTPTAITVVDGPFFSIYPYDIEKQLYTVTHVTHGVLVRGTNLVHAAPNIDALRATIEADVTRIFPAFPTIARYDSYFLSNKAKYDYVNDDRSLRWKQTHKYISFSGGKITGIFEMEKILEQIVERLRTADLSEPFQAKSDLSTLKGVPSDQCLESPTAPALEMRSEHDQ
jgi:hypothetical protein